VEEDAKSLGEKAEVSVKEDAKDFKEEAVNLVKE